MTSIGNIYRPLIINDSAFTIKENGSYEKVVTNTLLKSGINTYTVSRDIDLSGDTLNLPENSVIKFSSYARLRNGVISGTNNTIIADHRIFYNVDVKGTFDCVGNVAWFADATDLSETLNEWGIFDCTKLENLDKSSDIQKALDSSFRELVFPPVIYYIGNTLVLKKEKKLVFQGSEMFQALDQRKNYKFLSTSNNTSILFTCKNITLLKISISDETIQNYHKNSVVIEGGNFDVSLCSNYSSNCIEVLSNNKEKIWGLTINGTTIKGKLLYETGENFETRLNSIGININPSADTVADANVGYITNVRINAKVYHFGIGVKATDYNNGVGGYNWCTDVQIDGDILYCAQAVVSNVQVTDIKASIQAAKLFNDTTKMNYPLIKIMDAPTINAIECSISSPIFDIMAEGGGKYSNYYALEVPAVQPNQPKQDGVLLYGPFLCFYSRMLEANKNMIKGDTKYVTNPYYFFLKNTFNPITNNN